jgi:invasion protein IalB
LENSWEKDMLHIFRIALALASASFAALPAIAAGTEPTQITPSPAPSAQPPNTSPGITEQKFGQWALQCTSDHSMNPPCQIIYRLASDDQKQIATVISMARASGGAVGMQLALPLGFAIQGGVQISFGSKYSMSAAVSRCTLQGCLIEGTAPEALLTVMLKETAGTITLRMLHGNNVLLPVDLTGFAEAYKEMSTRS